MLKKIVALAAVVLLATTGVASAQSITILSSLPSAGVGALLLARN